LYDDWPPESTTDSIEASLKGAGYTVDKMLGADGDLPHLETVESGNYGAIFIRSHGGIIVVDGNDKIHILVRPFFDTPPDVAASGYNGIETMLVSTDWGFKYAYSFTDEFVRHHLGAARFPNTLMHLLVCHGGDPLGSDDMIKAFLDFGVGCYTGWTRNASLAHGDPTAVEFFKYLCGGTGRTVAGAIAKIKSLGHSPDPGTGADLVAYGATNLSLLGSACVKVAIAREELEMIKKRPREFVEIKVGPPGGLKIPDWSPIGGKITPVDARGRRFFITPLEPIQVFSSEQILEGVPE
jgi:hypothetical protein